MKKLTCEVCGSTELVKQDNFFICQDCGCKYSVEEVRKMMANVNVELKPSSSKPGTATLVNNYFEMAESAYEANNKSEAELYCNKIIEIDPTNYQAWFVKGKAAGWQSTTVNLRLMETVSAFIKSIKYTPDSEKKMVTKMARNEFISLSEALIRLCTEQFIDLPDGPRGDHVINVINSIVKGMEQLNSQANADIATEEMLESIAFEINQAVVSAWNKKVYPDYQGSDGRPSKYAFDRFIAHGDNCITILESAINLTDEYSERNIVRYENLVFFQEKIIDSCSWKWKYNEFGSDWTVDYQLTSEAKQIRRNKISGYKSKISKIKASVDAKKREETKERIKGKSIEDILKDGYSSLKNNDRIKALTVYDEVIKQLPDECVGYLGKAAAYGIDENASGGNTIMSALNAAIGKKSSQEYVPYVRCINSHVCGEKGVSLLMYAAAYYNAPATEFLIKLGASPNVKSPGYNITALWYVAHQRPPVGKEQDARKIAKILLDAGAFVNITNKGNVALYNNNTDFEIASMIKAKYPDARKGLGAGKNGGCYVATCVYGSYDCPQVWTLRRYRDNTLGSTWYGRLFIRTYYAISPTLVRWFGETRWFKKMWRGKLDRMVAKLQSKGVENTPYNDKDWR